MPRSGVPVVLAALIAALAVLPFSFARNSETASHVAYIAVECLALASTWVCWARTRVIAHRAAWLVLLLGWSIAAANDLVQFAAHHLGLPANAWRPGEVGAGVAFVVMAFASLRFSPHLVDRGARALLLDTGVLTVGMATPLFALRLFAHDGSAVDRASVVAFATVSLLSLAVGARLVMAWRASGSPWLLFVAGAAVANGVASLLAADAPATSGPLIGMSRALWVVAFACVFAAVATAAPSRRDHQTLFALERPSPPWVAVLVLSMAMPGVTLAVAESVGRPVSLPAISAGSVALAVLVSARMATLVAHLHGQSLTLSEVAIRDELTGIPNRRGWNHALTQACRLAEWDSRHFSLAVLDLDHFKAYNDAHGHQAGDALLSDTAAAWRQLLPADAVLARYGGEEFTLLLFDADIAAATTTLQAMRTAMTHAQTFSAGITAWRPGIPAELLFAEADQALYTAKHLGRDRSEVAASADTVVSPMSARGGPVHDSGATPAFGSRRSVAPARIAIAPTVDRRRTRRLARTRTEATSDLAS